MIKKPLLKSYGFFWPLRQTDALGVGVIQVTADVEKLI
jgi:hypothetical protein